MATLQSLRIQLNFIRAYLFTCTAADAAAVTETDTIVTWGEKLQNFMWPKEYLYEHIHRYAIADLHLMGGGVAAGTLETQMQKAVEFGRTHVLGCTLCSQKGFVCELCRESTVLYPFDIETTYRVRRFL